MTLNTTTHTGKSEIAVLDSSLVVELESYSVNYSVDKSRVELEIDLSEHSGLIDWDGITEIHITADFGYLILEGCSLISENVTFDSSWVECETSLNVNKVTTRDAF